jgi:hypothetical protein
VVKTIGGRVGEAATSADERAVIDGAGGLVPAGPVGEAGETLEPEGKLVCAPVSGEQDDQHGQLPHDRILLSRLGDR